MNKHLGNIIIKLFKGNTAEGIDIYIHDDQRLSVYIIKTNKNGTIKYQEEISTNLEELEKLLSQRKHATQISLRGNSIIHKKSHSKTDNLTKAVKQAIPGINPEHYKIQMYTGKFGKYFSIIPKEYFQKLVDKTKENVIEIALGPYVLADTKTSVCIPFQNIENINGDIVITSNDNDLNTSENIIDSQKVQSRFLLAYVNAMQFFKNNHNFKDSHFANYINLRILKFLMVYGLGFIFVVLLGSTFYRSNLQSKYELVQAENSNIQAQLLSLEAKHKGINEKFKFIETQNLLNKSKTSKYADRVLSCIPTQISVSNLSVNPILKEEDTSIEYEKGILKIYGNAKQSILINEWNEAIKTLDFVENSNVNLITTENRNSFQFYIEVEIKNV